MKRLIQRKIFIILIIGVSMAIIFDLPYSLFSTKLCSLTFLSRTSDSMETDVPNHSMLASCGGASLALAQFRGYIPPIDVYKPPPDVYKPPPYVPTDLYKPPPDVYKPPLEEDNPKNPEHNVSSDSENIESTPPKPPPKGHSINAPPQTLVYCLSELRYTNKQKAADCRTMIAEYMIRGVSELGAGDVCHHFLGQIEILLQQNKLDEAIQSLKDYINSNGDPDGSFVKYLSLIEGIQAYRDGSDIATAREKFAFAAE